MASTRRQRTWVLRNLRAALLAMVGIMFIATPATQAQTYKVIYNFTGGAGPEAGVTMDARGNLYGTTFEGGSAGKGIVYKLTNKNSTWVFTPLYAFAGGNDGALPQSGVVFGPNGTLYGTTTYGDGMRQSGMRQSGMRHGFQSQTSRNSVQNRTLPVDGNGNPPVHRRSGWRYSRIR